jgi:hypothetical protein
MFYSNPGIPGCHLGIRVFVSPDTSMDPFLPCPVKIMRPVPFSERVRVIADVMLSSIRPPIRPLTGDASGVDVSLGAVR